jgi:hypothetical protein
MLHNTVSSKSSHSYSVILSWLRQSADGHIAISDGLDLENPTPRGDAIKCGVNRLEESKDL